MAIALSVGLACVLLANITLRALSAGAHISYHSRVGFTFLWRLKFLATLPTETRNQYLDQVARRASSPDARNLISELRQSSFPDPNWDVISFIHQAQASLFPPGTASPEEKLGIVFNRTTRAFLWPPDKVFRQAVETDFIRSQQMRIPDVVQHLFASTTFYFTNPDTMADCATLATFRENDATSILAIFKKHSYFRHPKRFAYTGFLIFWFVSLALFVVLAKAGRKEFVRTVSYAVALTLIGLLIMLANCVLTELVPRCTLPMWELTIVSALILLGQTMDSFRRHRGLSRLIRARSGGTFVRHFLLICVKLCAVK
jgi:hypothetical protein